MRKNYDILVLALAMLAVGWAAIFVRLCGSLNPFLISFYRMAWASALLLPISLVWGRRDFLTLTLRQLTWMTLIGLVLAAHFASWISSLFYTTVSSSTVLVTTQPVFLVLFSRLFTDEKVGNRSLAAILLALLGALVIGWGDLRFSGAFLKGDLLALLGAVCAAVYLFLGRKLRQQVPNLAYIQIVYSTSALFLLVMVLLFAEWQWRFPLRLHFWLLLLGLIPSVLGHSLYNWALKHLRAYIVGTSILGEPIGASMYAWLIFREVPRATTMIGAILIFAGVSGLFYFERRNIA